MSKAKEKVVAEEEVTPNLPVNIEDQIKKELEAQRGQLGALPSNKIALKNKKFTLPDGQSTPGPFEAIVLDFVWFMVHYPGAYNSNNPQQPDCFAVGRDKPDGGLLLPHATVEKPLAANCGACEMNEWGSAPTGKGKACKNQRRLVVIPPKFDENTEPMTMYVSPGGLKNWDSYVSRLKNELGILPVQAITEISFDVDQSYPLLKFRFIERNTKVNDAWSMKEAAQGLLFRELEIKSEDDKK